MNEKISDPFRSRLQKLPPDQLVRAVVMLTTDVPETDRRLTRSERRALALAVREGAKRAADKIDRILEVYGGQRLTLEATNLGTVMVESTSEGIQALAEADEVRAILEDQKLKTPDHDAH